jgi:alkyl hydroperoxide reductase subunit AhpC
MRAIFVVDAEGIVRHRHVSRTGARFQTVGDLERAVAVLA